jgi:hypothetical protein
MDSSPQSLGYIDRRKLTKNSDPKIALMSNLPQGFTNRTVWFIFPTIVDKSIVNDSGENEPNDSV